MRKRTVFKDESSIFLNLEYTIKIMMMKENMMIHTLRKKSIIFIKKEQDDL